jgi:hypothetical protein
MPRRWKSTCATGAYEMALKWEDHKAVPHTITCPLDPRNNLSSLYARTTGDDEDFRVFVQQAELEDDLNPCCMACSALMGYDSTAIVTDNKHEFSDTDSNLNHADVDLEGWDGDSEFTWNEGDGDTITTAASTAANSLNSEGDSHYEGASLGERSFDFTAPSPQSERVADHEEEREQPSLSTQLCGFIIGSTTSPSARSR